jgi:hypothetical protein
LDEAADGITAPSNIAQAHGERDIHVQKDEVSGKWRYEFGSFG